jgi:hypothetical protein
MSDNVFEELDRMRPIANAERWTDLEREFEVVARRLASDVRADNIRTVDLTAYEAALSKHLRQAYQAARAATAAAIYFEYDLDNGWDSTFFICGAYRPEAAADDDWACDWESDFPGPSLDSFAALYAQNRGFAESPFATGSSLFLVARTVASFGRAALQAGTPPCVLCIGFHDQSPIQRLFHAA